MNIAEGIGFLILFSCVVFMTLESVKADCVISIRQLDIILFFCFLAILILVFNFDPRQTIRFDINEHMKAMDIMKIKGWDYAIHSSEYEGLYIICAYFFLIIAIGNYHFLPILPMLIEFIIFRYIIVDRIRSDGKTTVPFKDIGFTMYIWICTYGLMLAMTGIRCVLAVSVMFLAVYRDYIKNNRGVFTWILYVIPLFIHSFSLIMVLVRVFAMVKKKNRFIIPIFLLLVLSQPILNVAYSVFRGGYIGIVITKIGNYWIRRNMIRWIAGVTNAAKTVAISYLIVMFYYSYVVISIRKCRELFTEAEKRIYSLAVSVMYIGLAVSFNYLLLERFTYVLSWSFLIIMPLYHRFRMRTLSNTLINIFASLVMFWLFFFHDLYMILVNFTGVYFLAS